MALKNLTIPEIGYLKTDFELIFKKRKEDAQFHGRNLGAQNLPAIDDETPHSYEYQLQGEFQSDITAIEQKMATSLEEIHSIYSGKLSEIQYTKENLPNIKKEKEELNLQICKERKEQKLLEHNNRLSEIQDILDKQVERDWNKAQEDLRTVQQRIDRQFLNIMLKSRIIYYCILGIIGLSEFPLNLKVFENFREGVTTTMIMALSLVFAIPLTSHFSGFFTKRRKEQKLNIIFVLISIILIVSLSILVGFLRNDYLISVLGHSDPISRDTFIIISVLLFFIGSLLSYSHYDESNDLEVAYKNFDSAKTKYDQERPEYDEMIKTENKLYEGELNIINEDYINHKIKINTILESLMEEKTKIASTYDSCLKILQSVEADINANYLVAISIFRDYNYSARKNHEKPKSFRIDPPPLFLKFDKYKELDPNPMV